MAEAKKKIDQLVAVWKRLHIASKQLEPQLEEVRGDVRALILATGEEHVVTKLGTIGLQRQTRTDWEALARHLLSSEVIDAHVEAFRKQGEPYVCAPREWGIEAKAKVA